MVIVQNNPRISVSQMLSAYESQNTKRVYRGVLKGFLSFIYPDLTDENLDSLSLNYLDSPRDLRDDLLSYKESLAGQAPKTKTLKLSIVNQFLKLNGISLPEFLSKRVFAMKEKGAISDERIPTNNELRRICEYLPVHGKALALVLASSGMRVDEAIQIRDSDLDLSRNPVHVTVRSETTKTGRKRITFISPEAKEALEEWLTFRPKYLDQARARSAMYAREGRYDGILFPFTSGNFNNIWNNGLQRAGLYETDGRTNRVTMRPHNLRKFFRLRVGRFGRDESEALMGHQTGLNRVYADFGGVDGKARLASAYTKAIPELSIYGVKSFQLEKEILDKQSKFETIITNLSLENLALKRQFSAMDDKVQSQDAKLREVVDGISELKTTLSTLRRLVDKQ
ncbi:MAG: tyrosine-type recombinase/integrase [Candidatus Bathyarchaeota archaeon]|jgi:integrase|nr:tyrosine-type recombinase/integrase [Candidatus Bathyarchaeota archaeon]